jgi:hypothetical protein
MVDKLRYAASPAPIVYIIDEDEEDGCSGVLAFPGPIKSDTNEHDLFFYKIFFLMTTPFSLRRSYRTRIVFILAD